ncbi:isopenicillin N synthase family oxygenase [Roseomonas sp. NAR14]|uniref:2-oxoglutarate-dependent ethylene/succinate-forming enzyme n=1 Tax=Roseomonas acroporae TaxID=2937791 RepID=A0A9X1YJH2_9PROT|nr:2-oxoglutarate and iron-dependent oxygenase domain-containing protein [Roseomonas acroporae]MCK8787306.1 isopenicillin N synthase family oxygenase [Roseomonas acroporae]
MSEIPVIDLSPALEAPGGGTPADRLRLGREIDRTCREIGFFTVTGHGVPAAVMDALRDTANEFFALPLAEKRRAIHAVPGTPRGYIALGIEALSHGNALATPPDLKEYYHLGRESWPDEPYYTSGEGRRYFIPNLWPERPAGFREAAAAYYAAVERLALEMLRLSALGLGIDEHFFDDKFDRHITAMRLNHYPEQTEAPVPGQLRAGAHTDYGLFTILNGENVPGGLQVQTRGGRWGDTWLDVETDPRHFVINIGDLMMRWTNDRWVSNVHRVVNPPDGAAARSRRLSIAFFSHPNYDAPIECIAPAGDAKYPPVLSGEYRDLKYRQTRLAAA